MVDIAPGPNVVGPSSTLGSDNMNVTSTGTAVNWDGFEGSTGAAGWDPQIGLPASLIAPIAAAYNPQNAQQILNTAGQNAGMFGSLANNSQTKNVNLGNTSQYNAAGIAPLMMLNGGANINQAGTNQNVAAQQQAINNLNNIASGNGPNAATIAAQQQAQQNTAAQMAAIASAGGNPALAARNAGIAAAQANQQGAQNAVLGSAQEQLGAQGTLQSALGTLGSQGQAIPLAQAQLAQQAALSNQGVQTTGANQQAALNQQALAGNAAALNTSLLQQGNMNQQTNLANQQAYLAANGMNANQQNAMLSAGMQQSSYDTAQQEAYQQQYQQAQENIAALNANQGIAQMQQSTQLTGSEIGAVGTGLASLGMIAAAASDKRLKTNIHSAKRDIHSFLSSLGKGSSPSQPKYNLDWSK